MNKSLVPHTSLINMNVILLIPFSIKVIFCSISKKQQQLNKEYVQHGLSTHDHP